MDTFKIVKGISSLAVSVGAGAIVTNAIKATTPEDVKMIKKIVITIGGFAVSGIVADAASRYSNKTFDDAKKTYDETVNKVHNITDVD